MAKQPSYKTEAIILRSVDIKEYDRLYVVFSKEHGLMRVVGIGTRKPKAKLASGLEPLTRSEIFLVKCRGWDKATGVLIHDQFKNIRQNLETTVIARKTFAALEALAPEMESAQKIYQLLDEFLQLQDRQLQMRHQSRRFLQMAMIWKVIKWAGYEPRLYHCCRCQERLQENKIYNLIAPEGVVCSKCLKNEKQNCRILVGKEAVKLLRFFLQKDFRAIQKVRYDQQVFSQIQKVTKLMLVVVVKKEVIL